MSNTTLTSGGRRRHITCAMGKPTSRRFPLSAASVIAALRAIQAGRISYLEFVRRIIEAGCVGYFVFIAGKRAIYLGRDGDMHVEHFPSAGATSDDKIP